MRDFSDNTVLADNTPEDRLKELASLARLVTFARERASQLKAEFPSYCLDLAVGALLEEVYEVDTSSDLTADELEAWQTAVAH